MGEEGERQDEEEDWGGEGGKEEGRVGEGGEGEEGAFRGREWWGSQSLISPRFQSFYKVERPRDELCHLQQTFAACDRWDKCPEILRP